jgi:hypothetical protein
MDHMAQAERDNVDPPTSLMDHPDISTFREIERRMKEEKVSQVQHFINICVIWGEI